MALEIYDESSPLGRACRELFRENEPHKMIYLCNPPAAIHGTVETLSLADYYQNHEENIKKPFFAAADASRRMAERGGGRILFVGTIHAEKPCGAPLHSASMGALKNFCREAAVRWAQHGVVCCFIEVLPDNPALYDIPLYKDLRYRAPAPCDFSPEAAARFLFALAGAPALVNGAEIRIDGGLVQNYMDHSANYRKYLAQGGSK